MHQCIASKEVGEENSHYLQVMPYPAVLFMYIKGYVSPRFTYVLYDQPLWSVLAVLPLSHSCKWWYCPWLVSWNYQQGATREPRIQESALLVKLSGERAHRECKEDTELMVYQWCFISHLMRGPAARTKYNLRKSSISYVEKVIKLSSSEPRTCRAA